jgi:hypothetical protein
MEMVNVKAMPGSILAPNSGSIMEKKIRKKRKKQKFSLLLKDILNENHWVLGNRLNYVC